METEADMNNSQEGDGGASVRSIGRIGPVIDAITSSADGLTLHDLQEVTRIPRSSLYALCNALVDQNILRRDSGGRYVGSGTLLRWGGRLASRIQLVELSRPVMIRVARQTGFVVNMARMDMDSGQVVFLAKEENEMFHTTARVGSAMPAHSTALGKVLLAYAPMDWRGRYLGNSERSKRTSATLTGALELAEELRVVSLQGWAKDHEENEVGIHAYAAPVFDHTGRVVTALSVAFPSHLDRPQHDSLRRAIIQAASELSRDLGAG